MSKAQAFKVGGASYRMSNRLATLVLAAALMMTTLALMTTGVKAFSYNNGFDGWLNYALSNGYEKGKEKIFFNIIYY